MTLEFSPELKQAFEEMNARLAGIEALLSAKHPEQVLHEVEVKFSGGSLKRAIEFESDRQGRVIGRDQAVTPRS